MIKKSLAVGIVLLFIVSTVTPLVIGYNNEITNREFMDDLAFDCYDEYHSSKVSYYKEHLLKDYSNDENVELEEYAIPVEIPAMVRSEDPMDSPWPMSFHDVKHTGRSPYDTADNPMIEKWKYYAHSSIDETPTIGSDGTIYIHGYYGGKPFYFLAINPNGSLKWATQLDEVISGCGPAIADDGTIYMATWGSLYAINPNGTKKWRFKNQGIFSSPAIGKNGTIYFGTLGGFENEGRVYAMNSNGSEKWFYPTEDAITSSPAIADEGTIYIGSQDGHLYAINPNGSLKWRFKTGDRVSGSPSIAADGTVYFGSYDDYLYALNPDGTLKWKLYTVWGASANPSIDEDGTIYVGTDKLYAINPNGTKKWSYNLVKSNAIGWSSPAISADGTIFVGANIHAPYCGGGELIAINPDGTEKWRKKIANDWVDSSPSIAKDGTVYIGSTSTKMIKYGWATGAGYLHAFGPVEYNNPPEKPTIGIVDGGNSGYPGREYYFTFTATDPNNNPVQYFVDWGDGTHTDWSGGGSGSLKINQAASGEKIYLEHNYTRKDKYVIKAKSRDVFDEESVWTYFDFEVGGTVVLVAFLFGDIYDYEYHDGYDEISFKAENLKVIGFIPFLLRWYFSGEKITVTFGIGTLESKFVRAFCSGYI